MCLIFSHYLSSSRSILPKARKDRLADINMLPHFKAIRMNAGESRQSVLFFPPTHQRQNRLKNLACTLWREKTFHLRIVSFSLTLYHFWRPQSFIKCLMADIWRISQCQLFDKFSWSSVLLWGPSVFPWFLQSSGKAGTSTTTERVCNVLCFLAFFFGPSVTGFTLD